MSNRSPSTMMFPEFVALMAFVMCFVALAIDLMLPALGVIGDDLGVLDPNKNQLIISGVFIGVALGQLIYGPISDVKGRKPVLYLGVGIFIVGTLICLFSNNMEQMFIGRILQGFGAACPRTLTVAIVRDQYVGPQMARVMSLIMTVFILVPVVAPALGQVILMFFGWRAMFVLFLLLALAVVIWSFFRLPESLPAEKRVVFSFKNIWAGIKEVLRHKIAMANMIALGMIFGAFLGFLSSVQQIMQVTYQLGDMFPLYFAVLALGIGVSSFTNSRLVQRFGLYSLVKSAQGIVVIVSLSALLLSIVLSDVMPLWGAMFYFMLVLLCMGLLFGNLNAMIMEDFGHIAGLASSLVGSLSTLLAVILSMFIGQAFNETLLPVITGFLVLGSFSALLTYWASHQVKVAIK